MKSALAGDVGSCTRIGTPGIIATRSFQSKPGRLMMARWGDVNGLRRSAASSVLKVPVCFTLTAVTTGCRSFSTLLRQRWTVVERVETIQIDKLLDA